MSAARWSTSRAQSLKLVKKARNANINPVNPRPHHYDKCCLLRMARMRYIPTLNPLNKSRASSNPARGNNTREVNMGACRDVWLGKTAALRGERCAALPAITPSTIGRPDTYWRPHKPLSLADKNIGVAKEGPVTVVSVLSGTVPSR